MFHPRNSLCRKSKPTSPTSSVFSGFHACLRFNEGNNRDDRQAGLRDNVKIMIGGGQIDETVRAIILAPTRSASTLSRPFCCARAGWGQRTSALAEPTPARRPAYDARGSGTMDCVAPVNPTAYAGRKCSGRSGSRNTPEFRTDNFVMIDNTAAIAERAVLELDPDTVSPLVLQTAMGPTLDAVGYKQPQWPGNGVGDHQPYQYLDREYMPRGIRRLPLRSDRLLSTGCSSAAHHGLSKDFGISEHCRRFISACSANIRGFPNPAALQNHGRRC